MIKQQIVQMNEPDWKSLLFRLEKYIDCLNQYVPSSDGVLLEISVVQQHITEIKKQLGS